MPAAVRREVKARSRGQLERWDTAQETIVGVPARQSFGWNTKPPTLWVTQVRPALLVDVTIVVSWPSSFIPALVPRDSALAETTMHSSTRRAGQNCCGVHNPASRYASHDLPVRSSVSGRDDDLPV